MLRYCTFSLLLSYYLVTKLIQPITFQSRNQLDSLFNFKLMTSWMISRIYQSNFSIGRINKMSIGSNKATLFILLQVNCQTSNSQLFHIFVLKQLFKLRKIDFNLKFRYLCESLNINKDVRRDSVDLDDCSSMGWK